MAPTEFRHACSGNAVPQSPTGPALDRIRAVELEVAHHQAIHGGSNWRLGRLWPDEWNQLIMRALTTAEREAGRMLTRNEILDIVADAMRRNGISMNFVPGRRR